MCESNLKFTHIFIPTTRSDYDKNLYKYPFNFLNVIIKFELNSNPK